MPELLSQREPTPPRIAELLSRAGTETTALQFAAHLAGLAPAVAAGTTAAAAVAATRDQRANGAS